LLLHCILERGAFDVRIFFGPARRHCHLERISRGGEHLGQQGIGIERYGRDKLLELLLSQSLLRLRRRLLWRVRTLRRLRQQRRRRAGEHYGNHCSKPKLT
jgi:hypothetical protein